VLKQRSNLVAGVFLLFPTICHIADTPNGKKLSVSIAAIVFIAPIHPALVTLQTGSKTHHCSLICSGKTSSSIHPSQTRRV